LGIILYEILESITSRGHGYFIANRPNELKDIFRAVADIWNFLLKKRTRLYSSAASSIRFIECFMSFQTFK